MSEQTSFENLWTIYFAYKPIISYWTAQLPEQLIQSFHFPRTNWKKENDQEYKY